MAQAPVFHLGPRPPPPWFGEWSMFDHRVTSHPFQDVANACIICDQFRRVGLSDWFERYKCNIPECLFQAESKSELENHQQRFHRRCQFRCLDCGHEFASSSALRQHSRDRTHKIGWNHSALYAEMFPQFGQTHLIGDSPDDEERITYETRQGIVLGTLNMTELLNHRAHPTWGTWRFLQIVIELQQQEIRHLNERVDSLTAEVAEATRVRHGHGGTPSQGDGTSAGSTWPFWDLPHGFVPRDHWYDDEEMLPRSRSRST